MAMATKRSKALHNFTMPGDLRWGNQKFLRCMKVNSNGQIPAPVDGSNRVDSDPAGQRRGAASELPERKSPTQASPSSSGSRQLKVELGGSDGGIAAVREKVMLDLQTAADKMRESIFKEGLEGGETTVRPPTPPPPPLPVEGEAVRPWNLRTRRAPVKFPAGVGGWCVGAAAEGDGGMGHDAVFSQTRTPASGGDDGPGTSGKKRERPKISVALSKREIEEDFFSFVGHRPPRRPRKRHRAVQKQMDTLFPGLWLTEVTPDMYKVPDEEKQDIATKALEGKQAKIFGQAPSGVPLWQLGPESKHPGTPYILFPGNVGDSAVVAEVVERWACWDRFSTKKLLLSAESGGHAVGAFNVDNLEGVEAVVSAAEEQKSPAILQVWFAKTSTTRRR